MKYIITILITIFAFNASAQDFWGDLQNRGWSVFRMNDQNDVRVCGKQFKNGTDYAYCNTYNSSGTLTNDTKLDMGSDFAQESLSQKNTLGSNPVGISNGSIYLYGTQGVSVKHVNDMKSFLPTGVSVITDVNPITGLGGDPTEDFTASVSVFKINYTDYPISKGYGPDNVYKEAWNDAIRTIERADHDTTSNYHEAAIAAYYIKTNFPSNHDESSNIRAAILDHLNPDKSINLAAAMSYSPPSD